jgi:putative DNA primase/helicase
MAGEDRRPTAKAAAPRSPTGDRSEREEQAALNRIEHVTAASREPAPAKAPKKATASAAREAAAQEASEARSRAVPHEIRERFIGIGSKYYFPDGAAAFTDHGEKLTTRSENTEVIRSLIAIAQARGWGEIRVSGTERFRKEAWFAAGLAAIQVRGYRPTAFEEERLARAVSRREAGAAGREFPEPAAERSARHGGDTPDGTRSAHREPGPMTGRLVDHGRANYRHDPKEPMSYYLRIETAQGDREIWGVDLERAFRESLSRPTIGDEVTVRSDAREPVTVTSAERDADGRVVGQREIATHRNRWLIERNDFLAERAQAARTFRDTAIGAAQAVKAHPELEGSYLQLQAAKLGAERDIRNPADRARFVERVRWAIAAAIERGEPLEPVRLRERPREPERVLQPERTPGREDPTR